MYCGFPFTSLQHRTLYLEAISLSCAKVKLLENNAVYYSTFRIRHLFIFIRNIFPYLFAFVWHTSFIVLLDAGFGLS